MGLTNTSTGKQILFENNAYSDIDYTIAIARES